MAGAPGKARRRARARFDASVRRSTSGPSLRLNASTSRGNAPASRRRSGNPLRTRRRRPPGSLSHRPTAATESSPFAPFVRQPLLANSRERPPDRPAPLALPTSTNSARTNQTNHTSLIKLENVNDKSSADFYPARSSATCTRRRPRRRHRVPHQLGQGDARSRVERRGEGQVQEEPPLLHGRQDSLHALPLQHLSWLGTGLWECRVCWNRTGEYRRET